MTRSQMWAPVVPRRARLGHHYRVKKFTWYEDSNISHTHTPTHTPNTPLLVPSGQRKAKQHTTCPYSVKIFQLFRNPVGQKNYNQPSGVQFAVNVVIQSEAVCAGQTDSIQHRFQRNRAERQTSDCSDNKEHREDDGWWMPRGISGMRWIHFFHWDILTTGHYAVSVHRTSRLKKFCVICFPANSKLIADSSSRLA